MSAALRQRIEEEFAKALKDPALGVIPGFGKADAYGHEAGMPIERWVKDFLAGIDWNNQEVYIYFPNEFLHAIFSIIGKEEKRIWSVLQNTWWGPMLASKKQVSDFMAGKPIKRWQQEGADIVVFYGDNLIENINDVVLINAKSHDIARASRPPNIMSAQRLLKWFDYLLKKSELAKMLAKMNLWFLGVGYLIENNQAIARSVHIKDLLLLDLSKVPQINFDAAIQIQWHVKDMVENEQDRYTFIESLADIFIERWHTHSSRKEKKYKELVKNIKETVRTARESA